MKKGRHIKVILLAAIAGGQFLSGLPSLADSEETRAVPPVRSAQVQGSRQANADARGSLQKLIYQKSGPQSASIRQVADRSSRRGERRRPGIFSRLFSGSQSAEAIPGVGEPAPPIPPPPTLVYRTNQSGKRVATGGTREARTISLARPEGTGVSVVVGNGRVVAGDTKVSSAAVTADSFINPFESEADPEQDPLIMDLDALIAEESAALDRAQSEEVPELIVENEDSEQSIETSFEDQAVTEEDPAAEFLQAANPFDNSAESTDSESAALPEVESSQDQAPFDDSLAGISEEPVELPFVAEAAKSENLRAVPLLPVENEPVPETPVELPLDPVQVQPEPVVEVQEKPVVTEQRPTNGGDSRILASRARRDHQAYRIMARTGKTGFKGFCPVELRDNRELVDSREEFKSRFGLQTYFFSTAEARDQFEGNPARYAPTAGGSDVVLLVNTSEEEPGSLDFSLWYRDRLFLFRSRETRQIFSENPSRYADQY